MHPECAFVMAPPTQRIIFKFPSLPLKASPVSAHPPSQPHCMPSPTLHLTHLENHKFPKGSLYSLSPGKIILLLCAPPEKPSFTLISPVTSLSLLCAHTSSYFASTACVTIMFLLCAKHWRYNSERGLVPDPTEHS